MKSYIAISILLMCNTAFAAPTSTQTCRLSDDGVKSDIQTKGAKTELETLFNDDPKWSELLSCISTGKPEWLKIAASLKQVSDAGSSEQLGIAVGKALITEPTNVLELVIPSFSTWEFCGRLDDDAPDLDSKAAMINALKKQARALRRVPGDDGGELSKTVKACKMDIEKAKKNIASEKDNSD